MPHQSWVGGKNDAFQLDRRAGAVLKPCQYTLSKS